MNDTEPTPAEVNALMQRAELVVSTESLDIQPRGNYALCELISAGERTAGGIVLPEQRTSKLGRWKVLAVGPGRHTMTGVLVPMDVNVGDEVILCPPNGTVVELPLTEKTVLASEDTIIAVVKPRMS